MREPYLAGHVAGRRSVCLQPAADRTIAGQVGCAHIDLVRTRAIAGHRASRFVQQNAPGRPSGPASKAREIRAAASPRRPPVELDAMTHQGFSVIGFEFSGCGRRGQ